jgi:hypothetical protein
MHVLTRMDGRRSHADDLPILVHGLPRCDVTQRDLVASGNGIARGHRSVKCRAGRQRNTRDGYVVVGGKKNDG